MKRVFVFALAAICFSAATGCYTASSNVSRGTLNQAGRQTEGTVEAVKEVIIDGRQTRVGQIGGASVGAAAASGGLGRGTAGALGAAGAGVVGMVVGQKVEEFLTRKRGQEIVVRLDEGRTIVIVQEVPPGFQPGDRVAVLDTGINARVTPVWSN